MNGLLVNQKRKPKRREIVGVGGANFIHGTSKLKISLAHPYGLSRWQLVVQAEARTKIWPGDPDLNGIIVQIIPESFDVKEITQGNCKE